MNQATGNNIHTVQFKKSAIIGIHKNYIEEITDHSLWRRISNELQTSNHQPLQHPIRIFGIDQKISEQNDTEQLIEKQLANNNTVIYNPQAQEPCSTKNIISELVANKTTPHAIACLSDSHTDFSDEQISGIRQAKLICLVYGCSTSELIASNELLMAKLAEKNIFLGSNLASALLVSASLTNSKTTFIINGIHHSSSHTEKPCFDASLFYRALKDESLTTNSTLSEEDIIQFMQLHLGQRSISPAEQNLVVPLSKKISDMNNQGICDTLRLLQTEHHMPSKHSMTC